MTFAIHRFVNGQALELREVVPSGSPKIPDRVKWTPAIFSHYNLQGHACLEMPDGTMRIVVDGGSLRPI